MFNFYVHELQLYSWKEYLYTSSSGFGVSHEFTSFACFADFCYLCIDFALGFTCFEAALLFYYFVLHYVPQLLSPIGLMLAL